MATTGGNDFHMGSKNLHAYWDNFAVVGAMRLKKIKGKSVHGFRSGACQLSAAVLADLW